MDQTHPLTEELVFPIADAIEAELERQYKAAENWEEAKDVREGLDYCMIARAVLLAHERLLATKPLYAVK